MESDGLMFSIVLTAFLPYVALSRPPQGTKTATDHAVIPEILPDKPVYQAALDTIQDTIARLQRLAVVVRSSSISSLALAANKQYDIINPVPLAEFERLALLFVKGRFHGVDDDLARHLARSITFRRLSIIHNQRNRNRLRVSYHSSTTSQADLDSPSTRFSESRQAGTSFTSTLMKPADQHSFDPPSATSEGKSEQVRSQRFKNLEPYVCISESCTDPFVSFKSFTAWREHMENVHTLEWARQVHKPTVWYCDEDAHEYCEFINKDDFRQHLDSEHHGEYTDNKYTRKLSRNTMSVPRARNICPLCSADILEILALRGPGVDRGPTTEEKGLRRERGSNTNFRAFDDISSSDDDDPKSPTSRQAANKTDLTNRVLSRHVASHLRSLATLSSRYLDEDHAPAESQQAVFGSVDEGCEKSKLARDFPEADGSLFFEDIAQDERPAIDEPDLINSVTTTSQNWSHTNRRLDFTPDVAPSPASLSKSRGIRDDQSRGWAVVAARRGTLMVLSHFLSRLQYYSKAKAKAKASEAIGNLEWPHASDPRMHPLVETGRASSPRNTSAAKFLRASGLLLNTAAVGLFRRPSRRGTEYKSMSMSDQDTGHHGRAHRERTISIFGSSQNTHTTLRSLVGVTFPSQRSHEKSTGDSDKLAELVNPEVNVGDEHIGHIILAAFEDVYNDLRGTDKLLSLESFSAFLKGVQGESDVKLDRQVYARSEFLEVLFKQYDMNAISPTIEKDLSKPITHYFIKSCHNVLGAHLERNLNLQDVIKNVGLFSFPLFLYLWLRILY